MFIKFGYVLLGVFQIFQGLKSFYDPGNHPPAPAVPPLTPGIWYVDIWTEFVETASLW